MTVHPTRRNVLATGALLPMLAVRAAARTDSAAQLGAIEKRTGGRLGVAALDTASGEQLSYRANERFAMCSTFKFLAAAAVLQRTDKDEARLDRIVAYGPADLLDYAPVTSAHVKEGGMTLGALCAAAIEYSDNTAGNLLLAQIGGPAGLTHFARSLGDRTTRLDRTEPMLNTAIAGDQRDTTSPQAMAADMEKLLLGNALSADARAMLEDWMRECKTADHRIRAGLPKDWRIGSKTGTGRNSTANEIAILRPPGRKPVLVASYLTGAKVPAAALDAAHADIGRLVADRFA